MNSESPESIAKKFIEIAAKYKSNMRLYYSPYIDYIGYMFDKKICSYDDHLIRNTFNGEEKIVTKEAMLNPRTILLTGSSAAWGACASNDKYTIASKLSSKLDRPIINFSFAGSTILQNALMLSSLLREYSTESSCPKTIVFYGFANDIGLIFREKNPFYYPSQEVLHYDIKAIMRFAGLRPLHTYYIEDILQSSQAKRKLGDDYRMKNLFPYLAGEYLHTFSNLKVIHENIIMRKAYDIIFSKVSENSISKLLNEDILNSFFKSMNIMKEIDELNYYLNDESIFNKLYEPIGRLLEPASAILYGIKKKYKVNFVFINQASYLDIGRDLDIPYYQKLVFNQLFKNRDRDFPKGAAIFTISSLLYSKIQNNIISDFNKLFRDISYFDMNQSESLRKQIDSNEYPVFCDDLHMSDFGYHLVASDIANLIK